MKTFYFIKIDDIGHVFLVSRSITKENLNIPEFFINEVFGKEEDIFNNNQATKLLGQNDIIKVVEQNEEVLIYDPEYSPYFVEGKTYLERLNDPGMKIDKTSFYKKKIEEYFKYIKEDTLSKIIETFR